MVVQYWGITPEVNAIRLTTGPGAAAVAPITAAYEAAGAAHITAGVDMLLNALTGATGWTGLGGTSMLAAATPKSEWSVEAGAHAQAAVGLLSAAATAHTAAATATVPYPVVISNRIREAVLEATNIIGQNTPAIGEANVEYGEYWAQNAGAMTGYQAAGMAIAQGLSIPLRPPIPTSIPGAGIGGAAVGVGTQGVATGVQALGSGLGETASVAGPAAMGGTAPLGMSRAPSPGSSSPQPGTGADPALPGVALGRPEGGDLLSNSAQSLMAPRQWAPSMLQGAVSPLQSVLSAPMSMGGQLSGLITPALSAMNGAGGLPAGAPGGALASALSGVNGGYTPAEGAPLTAALTKSAGGAAGGVGGPVGLPAAWWGPAAADGTGATVGQNAAKAAGRTPAGSIAGGPGMAPGMYGMPGAAAAGRRSDQSVRSADDADHEVVLDDSDAVPILTASGVVYADGGG